MVIAELLGTDDTVEISLHKLLDEIDLGKVVQRGWAQYVEDADDVLVVEVAQELDFAEGTEAEHRMVEWCDALDSDLALGLEVDGRADDAICAFSDDVEWLVRRAHHEVGHFLFQPIHRCGNI